jgi:hypothetical protein
MIAQVDTDILRELTLARDRLIRCEGAVDQAAKAVEAIRAAHRRAVEERDAERELVARLERELKEGASRRPLLAAIEAAGRIAADPDDPDDDAADDFPTPPDYDRAVAAGLEAAEARRPDVRAARRARERRRAEKAPALRELRGPKNAREGIELIDAARVDLAERRAGKVVAPEVIGPPKFVEGAPDGPWPGEERPDGPPADVTRAGDIAVVREAIEEVEGPAGDGSRTRVCSRCRRGFPIEGGRCPACHHAISRPAREVLANLGADGPVLLATGGAGDERYAFAIHHRPWDAAAIRRAAELIEGEGADGTRSAVCSDCRAVFSSSQARCPKCRCPARRATIAVMVDVGAEPPATRESLAAPDPGPRPAAGRASGAARRERAKGKAVADAAE